MADEEELSGEAAAEARVRAFVGAPENPNVSGVVRKRIGSDAKGRAILESDESKALRKAGYGPLQRALVLSPLGAALEKSRTSDARLEDADIRQELREREFAVKMREEQSRKLDADKELAAAAEFFERSDEIDPASPDAAAQLRRLKPLISAETPTGKTAMRRWEILANKNIEYREMLTEEVNEAVRKGYTGVVKNADGSIDPWESHAGIAEWAKNREQEQLLRADTLRQEKFNREDARVATGREFDAAQSDLRTLRSQRALLEKAIVDAIDPEEVKTLEEQLGDLEVQMGEVVKARRSASNPVTPMASEPAAIQTAAATQSKDVNAAREALRKQRESRQ